MKASIFELYEEVSIASEENDGRSTFATGLILVTLSNVTAISVSLTRSVMEFSLRT